MAIRPVFFQNDFEEWPYSTNGGTLFKLFISCDPIPKIGTSPIPVKSMAHVNSEDEIGDIAVILFSEDIDPSVFNNTAYVIDENTVGTSDTAHILKIYGFLEEKTNIDYENKSITGGYCDLEFRNVGATSHDHFIRSAIASYADHDFSKITGISGAPVFDQTTNRLCGMAVRGGLNHGAVTVWYFDIFYIVTILERLKLN